MLKITSCSASYQSNLFYSDSSESKDTQIILMTHNLESSDFLTKLNENVVNRLKEIDLDLVHEKNVAETFESFFTQMNWFINSQFKNARSIDIGISLALLIVIKDTIFIYQFGRLLCGIIKKDKMESLGQEWKNFNVKSREDLRLLGGKGEEIYPKPIQFKLGKDDYFLLVPSSHSEYFVMDQPDIHNFKDRIINNYVKNPFSFCIVEHTNKAVSKSIFAKLKFRISAILMFALIIFSAVYVFKGNNQVEDAIQVKKEFVDQTLKNISLEKIPEALQINYEKMMNPSKDISLFKEWSTNINFRITENPSFDLNNIYLISYDKLIVFDKKNLRSQWKKNLGVTIDDLVLIDGNLMLAICSNNRTYCLKRDTGDIVWEQPHNMVSEPDSCNYLLPKQITLDQDRRLNASLVLYPTKNKVYLIENTKGNIKCFYSSTENISFISDYDVVDKSFYLVEKTKLTKIKLNILNL